MMNEKWKDIFSLDDTGDLDDDVISQLNSKKSTCQRILSVLKLKKGVPLSIDELIVALFRLYKIKPKRIYITNCLFRLKAKGHIYKIIGNKGLYYSPSVPPFSEVD